MIIRTIDLLLVAAMLASAAWTFKVKNDSERALARIATLQERLDRERERMDLLRADWSLLTSPDRLQRLAERHGEELGLEPARPEQFVTFGDVPVRLPPMPAIDAVGVGAQAESGGGPDAISKILTGATGD